MNFSLAYPIVAVFGKFDPITLFFTLASSIGDFPL